MRAAFLHVATDLAAFAGTALAGALILVFGWDRFDPIASIAVAALMLWSGWRLVRESTEVFLERAPDGIDPEAIGRALVAEPGVVEVHDLHVWTVTSGFPALSAHVLVETDADCHALRRELEQMLAERFGLLHTTLQVDHRSLVELGVPSAGSRRSTRVRAVASLAGKTAIVTGASSGIGAATARALARRRACASSAARGASSGSRPRSRSRSTSPTRRAASAFVDRAVARARRDRHPRQRRRPRARARARSTSRPRRTSDACSRRT